MPGFNKTGPLGNGPATGGRRGSCVPESQKPESDFSRRGMGNGFRDGSGMRNGSGMGMRNGTGMGMRRGCFRNFYGNQPQYNNQEEEINILKTEAASVKSILEKIMNKITTLENK